MQTFLVRIVWQWKTVESILVLNTTQGKQNVEYLRKRHQNGEQCSTAVQTQYQEYTVHQGPLNTCFLYLLQCWKQFIQKKTTVEQQIVNNRFNQPQCAMHCPKLCSALSLIQSNMYYQKKKCILEILLDMILLDVDILLIRCYLLDIMLNIL